jgi:hypothetical protein
LTPIPVGSAVVDNCLMVQIAIRCHPSVPVSADELEGWLELEVDHLRAESPQGTIRLSRLTQGLPNVDIDIGWLVELELPDREPLLTGNRLGEVIRDMRLLGLQPTLLVPIDLSDWSRQRDHALAAAPNTISSQSTGSRFPLEQNASNGRSTVDQMGECSFPASDPPAVWTWDARGAREPMTGRDGGFPRFERRERPTGRAA